jgi:hypothetical protein
MSDYSQFQKSTRDTLTNVSNDIRSLKAFENSARDTLNFAYQDIRSLQKFEDFTRATLTHAYQDIRRLQTRQAKLQVAVMLVMAAATVCTGVAAYRSVRLWWCRHKRKATGNGGDATDKGGNATGNGGDATDNGKGGDATDNGRDDKQ